MQYEAFISELRRKLIAGNVAKPDEIVGCTEGQIREIMDAQRVSRLPAVYIEFLKQMGVMAGRLFRGEDVFYNSLLRNKDVAIEVINEIELGILLPEDAFVDFWSGHVYGFGYFLTRSNEDDPIVYSAGEGLCRPYDSYPKTGVMKTGEKWSSYFQKAVEQSIDLNVRR